MTVEDSVWLVVGVIFLFVIIGYGAVFIALYPHVWDNVVKKYYIYRNYFKK